MKIERNKISLKRRKRRFFANSVITVLTAVCLIKHSYSYKYYSRARVSVVKWKANNAAIISALKPF